MAHTDRDDERWMRENHNDLPCPFDDPPFINGRVPVHAISCEICDTLWSGRNRRRFSISTAAYSAWSKDCRREERNRARTTMRECRDWDELVIDYRRPYYD